jgi:hypothetical protein
MVLHPPGGGRHINDIPPVTVVNTTMDMVDINEL